MDTKKEMKRNEGNFSNTKRQYAKQRIVYVDEAGVDDTEDYYTGWCEKSNTILRPQIRTQNGANQYGRSNFEWSNYCSDDFRGILQHQ
ncbi:hypothetical protein [Moorena bouillonii]|uniref:hypothetical protein n=1 Tax=Moorena bouillonii TaxID=207920 RepID=UPI0018E99DFF|nr:hypothetical protein [Moorena bouillonii]